VETFAEGPWGAKYPPIATLWRRAWEHVIPFFAFPPEVRRVIYTTNAIASLHMRLRKIITARGHFRSDDAALKLLWLALKTKTPNSSWCGRAVSAVTLFSAERARRT